MIRTGDEYRESLRDGRVVWMNGERVDDVTAHPAFRPIVDVRARIYDMAHEEEHRERLTYDEDGERFAVGLKLPRTHAQAPPFAHLAAVYHSFDFSGALDLVRHAAGLSHRVPA